MQWKEKVFYGNTQYNWMSSEQGNFFKAEGYQSASALYYEKKIDLYKMLFINWHGRVQNVLGDLDEKTKTGDDYPARIYVILPASWFSIYPRSINYV